MCKWFRCQQPGSAFKRQIACRLRHVTANGPTPSRNCHPRGGSLRHGGVESPWFLFFFLKLIIHHVSRRNRTTRDGDDDGHDGCHILSVSGGFCFSHLHTKTSVERKVKRSWCFSFIGTISVITHPGGMRSLVAVACFCTTFERRLQGETQGVLVE